MNINNQMGGLLLKIIKNYLTSKSNNILIFLLIS